MLIRLTPHLSQNATMPKDENRKRRRATTDNGGVQCIALPPILSLFLFITVKVLNATTLSNKYLKCTYTVYNARGRKFIFSATLVATSHSTLYNNPASIPPLTPHHPPIKPTLHPSHCLTIVPTKPCLHPAQAVAIFAHFSAIFARRFCLPKLGDIFTESIFYLSTPWLSQQGTLFAPYSSI